MSKEASDHLWVMYKDSKDQDVQLAAFEELVIHYQYLVDGVSWKIKSGLPEFVDEEELRSQGQLGLLRALGKYQRERGPFSRYASSVIWGAIHDWLRAEDFAPRGLRKQQRDMDAARRELSQDGEDVDPQDLADAMGISVDDIDKIEQRLIRSEIAPTDPAFMPAYSHEKMAGSALWSQDMCWMFVAWLQQWDDLTQEIVLLRYWKGMSLKAIGELIQEPPNVVRSKHRAVLTKLLPFMTDIAT